ncbi:MAG: hypothetical protein QOD02_5574, partial [Mycobacterium sp.]|jgi:hypothetical protein|nr:hypothetical protein [Mycobacterium sp.]
VVFAFGAFAVAVGTMALNLHRYLSAELRTNRWFVGCGGGLCADGEDQVGGRSQCRLCGRPGGVLAVLSMWVRLITSRGWGRSRRRRGSGWPKARGCAPLRGS